MVRCRKGMSAGWKVSERNEYQMEGCRKGMSTGRKGVGKGSVADGRVSERDEYGMEGCRNGMSARIGGDEWEVGRRL